MKFFAMIFVMCAVSILNLAQTNKPKTKSQTTKPKPIATPTKKLSNVKAKPAATPKKPDENTVWEKAIVADPRDARIAALKKFIETFPKSTRKNEALTMIAFFHTDAGNEKLAGRDIDGAVAEFKKAATDAPKPIADQLWTEALSKIAANLYFRGAQENAIEIEKILETKAETNVKQLLDIANFYLTIENGGEAKRIVEKAVALEPTSVASYQTLGLANRIDFQLADSAIAYERALELDPTSLAAKRGLAEMKRALGKADEAVKLYREILVSDADFVPAQTGLILALFDAGKRVEAEAELTKSLEANPGNVILLAGAAYWYAAHNEGAKAIELAQKAIDSDPRFIWSHIALARGLLLQNRAADAEKTLIGARSYGNFPTVEYELASARLAAGYYREAAEGLSRVFNIKDGKVSTALGGRVNRDAQTFSDLIADERKASIFTPKAADNAEFAAQLTGLLEFKQQFDSTDSKDESIAAAADQFVKGSDRMKLYRQIFAATQLVDKKIALQKAIELTKAATTAVDDGLAVPNATIAVMASELYEARAIAGTKGEYIVVPDVPRPTLSAVLRGRLEEIAGWAQYNLGSADEAIIRLRRAVGVLPTDSAWWRSSTWRLGAAYALAGKDAEALDMYIKSYKSAARVDMIRYSLIESLYRKINGNTDGLSDKIGPSLVPQVAPETVEQKADPAPSPTPEPSPTTEIKVEPTPMPTPMPEATPAPQNSPTPNEKTEVKTKELFPPVIITIPSNANKPITEEPKPETNPSPTPVPNATPTLPTESQTVIEDARSRIVETKPEAPPEIKPCKINVSEETVNLIAGGGDLAVIIGLDDDSEIGTITTKTSSEQDVTIRREQIAGMKTRALFVLRSISDRLGLYQVTFELPCGKRTVAVNVR